MMKDDEDAIGIDVNVMKRAMSKVTTRSSVGERKDLIVKVQGVPLRKRTQV
jgi:hypothetical protein